MKGKRSADLVTDADVLKYAGDDARLCYALAAKYLPQWPEKEQRISELNRESGIRGIHTDAALIDAGIASLEPQLQAAMDKIPWVKDGGKPLSPNALRKHGLAVGIPVPASLAKDNPDFLAWAEEYSEKYPWVRAVGQYRSINAMLCKVQSIRDGIDAATGMLPFGIKYYGAGTGRFCLPGSAEVLAPSGWVRLDQWGGGSIMQWSADGSLTFYNALANRFTGGGDMAILESGYKVKVPVTTEHKVVYVSDSGRVSTKRASELGAGYVGVPTTGFFTTPASAQSVLTEDQARLLVACQADGNLHKKGHWFFGFKKRAKQDRLVALLTRMSVKHSTYSYDNGRLCVYVPREAVLPCMSKTFDITVLLACSSEVIRAFVDEVAYWDGAFVGGDGVYRYASCIQNNADVLNTMAHLIGRRGCVRRYKVRGGARQDTFQVRVQKTRSHSPAQMRVSDIVHYNGDVFCPTTQTGFFLCRYDGFIFVTGNSGGAGEGGGRFNCQNLPRKPMYGVDVRPMFMARPGYTFITADYAQIEARYLLWLAGDEAALAPMRAGTSVYQAAAEASGMCEPGFDLKHNDPHKYQLIKSATLGAGYQASGPKFRAFAKTMGLELTEEEANSTIAEWRKKNWRVTQLWREHHNALAFSARRKDDMHQIELRSGRILTYWEPRACGREISAFQIRGAPRAYLYGGKLTENETQASCRDILCDAWLAVDKAGLPPVVLSVHDELVMEVRKDEAAQVAKELETCMTTCSPWAEGLPLGVEICIADRYTK
jgi:hypothetical protein